MPENYFSLVRREPMLVAYWRQNDTSSAIDMTDYGSRYGLTGTYSGRSLGPALIQSDSGAGSSSLAAGYGEVADATPLHITGDISIEAWVFASSTPTGNILAKQDSGASQAAPYALQLANGSVEFSLGNGSSSAILHGGNIFVGSPSHIVATSFRGYMTLYVNGASVATGSLGAQAVADSAQPLYVGKTTALAGIELIGEVALYSGALSARRVDRHFTIGQQILADPAHYWTVDSPVAA